MQEQNTATKGLNIFQGILAVIITTLIFYPMFGGKLMILNGTFIYFSYFMALFLVAILAIVDFVQLFLLRKKGTTPSKQNNILVFNFVSLIIMIGLLEGHYIFSPLLAIIYIFLILTQTFQFISNKNEEAALYQITIFDIIQRLFFYLTAVMMLLGNQPFEIWNLPIATTALIVLVIISVINFALKMRKV